MQCDRAQEQFSDYIEGLLSPAMRQVFEQHLSVCDGCRADIEQLQSVYAMFADGLPTVEVPPGFRAGILNAIREQPAPETALSRIKAWLTPSGSGPARLAPLGVAALVIAVVAVGGTKLVTSLSTTAGGAPAGTSAEASLNPWSGIQVNVQNQNGILQGVRTYTAGGDIYHVFGLHLPDHMAATSASAYVIQNPSALSNDSELKDPAYATPAWTGSIEPGVSVQVPVAVVSSVPAGTSMTLLVEWNDAVGEHKEACILPISNASRQTMVVSAGEPLEQALETVSVAYGTPVMLNDSAVAELSQPISQGLDDTDNSMSACLASLVLPDSLTFEQQSDGAYLVDSQPNPV